MKKHDFTPFLALFGIFLLFVGFVLLLFLGQQEDRYAIVSFVILCLGCTLFGIGIGKWISHRLHSVLKESKSPKKAPTLPNIQTPTTDNRRGSEIRCRACLFLRNSAFLPQRKGFPVNVQRLGRHIGLQGGLPGLRGDVGEIMGETAH